LPCLLSIASLFFYFRYTATPPIALFKGHPPYMRDGSRLLVIGFPVSRVPPPEEQAIPPSFHFPLFAFFCRKSILCTLSTPPGLLVPYTFLPPAVPFSDEVCLGPSSPVTNFFLRTLASPDLLSRFFPIRCSLFRPLSSSMRHSLSRAPFSFSFWPYLLFSSRKKPGWRSGFLLRESGHLRQRLKL